MLFSFQRGQCGRTLCENTYKFQSSPIIRTFEHIETKLETTERNIFYYALLTTTSRRNDFKYTEIELFYRSKLVVKDWQTLVGTTVKLYNLAATTGHLRFIQVFENTFEKIRTNFFFFFKNVHNMCFLIS